MLPESCGWQSSACATRHSSRPVKNVTMNQPARRIRTDVTLMAVPFILLPLQPGSDSWSRRAATVGPFVRWGSGGTCRKKKRTGLRDSPLHIYFCDEILEGRRVWDSKRRSRPAPLGSTPKIRSGAHAGLRFDIGAAGCLAANSATQPRMQISTSPKLPSSARRRPSKSSVRFPKMPFRL